MLRIGMALGLGLGGFNTFDSHYHLNNGGFLCTHQGKRGKTWRRCEAGGGGGHVHSRKRARVGVYSYALEGGLYTAWVR